MIYRHETYVCLPIKDPETGEHLDDEEVKVLLTLEYTPGTPERGPSYASGGEPAEGADVELVSYEIWEVGFISAAYWRKPGMPFDAAIDQAVDELMANEDRCNAMCESAAEEHAARTSFARGGRRRWENEI